MPKSGFIVRDSKAACERVLFSSDSTTAWYPNQNQGCGVRRYLVKIQTLDCGNRKF